MKAPQFYTGLGFQKTLLNPPVNGEIRGLFKTFDCFSSTFQGKFNFQGLFKKVLYIQVLFKPVQTLYLPVENVEKFHFNITGCKLHDFL